jgi:RCC1 and BTB domain-containing protein
MDRLFALEAPFIVGPMAAGQYNTMVAAARKGKTPNTFTWGPNFNSQLGHQFLELGPLPTPSKLDLLKTANIVQVEMGYAHALALGADGTLYVWGANSFGQLGTGDSKERSKPTPVTSFHGSPVVRIAAGQHSSYALTATGCESALA